MPESSIQNPSSRIRLTFVCTGNICRSPLAEYLFRDFTGKQGNARRFEIDSAGTHAMDGNHATYEAMEAGRRRGLDLRPHRAREIDGGIMTAADLVLVMTRAHHDWLCARYPGLENKIYLAMLYPGRQTGRDRGNVDVPDPIGESVEYYLKVLDMLEPVLPEIHRGALEEEIV